MQKLVRMTLSRSPRLLKPHNHLKILKSSSLGGVVCKVFDEMPACVDPIGIARFPLEGHRWVHSAPEHKAAAPVERSGEGKVDDGGGGNAKVKRKKLKGKRAVVRWLKFFRYKKKKDFERMTAEEKILHKLRKAQRKEERLLEALKKIEPSESAETAHDPEILTPEEHFFFLKMGLKCKNYVPVGRRGIYQGVILNMHLHWKKHQTLQVIVKTFSPEEVKDIASELARLTGGIVLGIHEEYTIIMYRGKNYSQPPTEIMSPRITLSRKKALDKSKYMDGLRAVRKHIPKLEQDLELLRAQAQRKVEFSSDAIEETPEDIESVESESSSNLKLEPSDKLKEILDRRKESPEDDLITDGDMASDSEDLSDIFETDSDKETENKAQRPLYLEEFEKFPVKSDGEPDDFEDHLRQISMDSKKAKSLNEEDAGLPNFDEVDRIFLRAASLLKKKRR
ncbi:uncharacterized CRM domain-containing protein At3g25440, chloroplastic isoform X2 [Rosa rugosa]|uniref:uncharacterized CRM domain-containing protein At3g25440, chloroplastic isoform X2 n=1 Tax=Rosa rugosa TaxID=74645 RepID=UPI002B403289|nr:uncharacterized CRM domain-containing protein At3g25440, chloroplastic isoform X2 [Rosa rugosa]